MRRYHVIVAFVLVHGAVFAGEGPEASYLPKERRAASPGNRTYYIDPAGGSDSHPGLKKEQAWRTFAPVNRLLLASGDRVEIVAPGSFDRTLMLMGEATAGNPIEVRFAPGRYDFFPAGALKRAYQISNTNGDPDTGKAIGILLDGARHVRISGAGARLVYRGKMIEFCIDGCENISISDLKFDYHRPTVSEFRVTAAMQDQVDIEVHPDSWYKIQDGAINWIGEGWSYATGLAQELDLDLNEIWRRKDPLAGLRIEEISPFLIRAHGKHNMTAGRVYQIRSTFRDCAGVFIRRSKNITWRKVDFHYLHGMGLVNQFSENLTFDTVSIAPDKQSGRTCAAWADGIQVSGCRGKLVVKNCVFSGAHDDAINIHGTYLRVIERLSEKRVKVRFMHDQTFGFKAFNPGDEITFVDSNSLETCGANTIKDAVLENPRDMLLTLERPVPPDIGSPDVVENVTWNPEVEITGCSVHRIPTRGFLITTRRKVVVADNTFHRTHMSAILVAIDARGWFESGPVRDMTIRGNRFINCREPVVNINPENNVPNPVVHRNIRIADNEFVLRGGTSIRAKSTTGLVIAGNTTYSEQSLTDQQAIQTNDCAEVRMEMNRYVPLSDWAAEAEADDGQ